MQTGWVQMQVSGKDSFADLLKHAELQQMDVLDDSQMFEHQLPSPFQYTSKDGGRPEIVTCSIKS
jgi:hypothetical protein